MIAHHRTIIVRLIVAMLFSCALVAAPVLTHAQEDLADREQLAMQAALAAVSPSVVQIQTIGGRDTTAGGLGQNTSSALVISEDGYLVSSAFNFAQKPSAILVTLENGSTMPARLVATDHNREIVLLKVDLPAGTRPLTISEVAPRDSVRVGTWALAVGRMYEVDQANVSVGIISAIDRIWGKAVQTDAKVSPSNYGGPLVDIHGRVIGILAPLTLQAGMGGPGWYDSGIGFAVPLADIEAVLPRLKKGDDLYRGLMGVSLEGRDLYSVVPKIAAVHPRGPAQKAGLRAKDRVVEVNGTAIISQAQMKHALGPLYAGETINIVVMRDEQRVEATLELTDKLIPYAHPFLGVLPVRDDESEVGVAVRYVYPDSPAAVAGIKVGDRITKLSDQEVADTAALRQKLSEFIPEEKVTVTIDREGAASSHEVTLTALPETLPAELPTQDELGPFEGERPKTGMFGLKLAEFKNECSVYVPENYRPDLSCGVVIWLQAPGKFDGEALLARWKEHCTKRNLILLAPRPRDEKTWVADESEFIRRAYDNIEKSYSIDGSRVVVHGFEGGGAMAYYVAFSQRDAVRGVAAVQSAIPAGVRPPATDPANRLAIYIATSAKNKQVDRIGKQIKALREMKYPVTDDKLDGEPRYLNDAELAKLVNWIDSLDRI